MRKKLNWRLLVACTVILILIGIGLIWILNEKEGISWHITAPIAFVIIGCILAFLQWFMPISPATSKGVAPPTWEKLPEVPRAFQERLLAAQEKGKGAIIVPAPKSEVRRVVYYLLDKHEVLGNQSVRRRPRIIQEARVNPYSVDGYAYYAATFGSIDPGNYLVWKSETGRKPTIETAGDLSLSQGAGVRPDEVFPVYFD